MRRWSRGWTALAYPVLWVAVDTLLATWFPEGNFGSLAYTQADVLARENSNIFGRLWIVAGFLPTVDELDSFITTNIGGVPASRIASDQSTARPAPHQPA